MAVDKKKLWMLIGGALALALVLVLALVRCAAPEDVTDKKKPTIGMCLRQCEENPQYSQLLQEKFTQAGYAVSICDGKNDQIRQIEQITTLLNEDVRLLVIEPVITDAMEEVIPLLMSKNIPAVFIEHKPEAALEMWNRLSFVTGAKEQLGALQGQLVLELENQGDLNEDGQVSCLLLSGPEDDTRAKMQAETAIQALVEKGLTVEQIDMGWGEWTQASGHARCAKALAQYGKDMDVIICGDEAITLGALEAISAGGWQVGRDYWLIGAGAEEKIQTDHMTATVVLDMDAVAQQVASTALGLMNGETVEKEYYVNLKTIVEADGE